MEELMAYCQAVKEQIAAGTIGGRPGPLSPPPIGLFRLIEGANSRYPFDNNGCVGVYTDEKEGTETYVINDVLVQREICSTDEEEATFERNNPMVPVSIRGLKKIPLSRPPTPPESTTDMTCCKEVCIFETAMVAQAALAYFNEKQNTDYKLVEPRDSFAFYDSDVEWMHTNFTAKPRAALDGGNGDSSIKLFFAEGIVKPEGSTKYHYEIIACCILNGVTAGNCWKCPDSLLISHPTSGFRQGC